MCYEFMGQHTSLKLILRVDEKESIDSTLHYAPPGSTDAFVFIVADLYVCTCMRTTRTHWFFLAVSLETQ